MNSSIRKTNRQNVTEVHRSSTPVVRQRNGMGRERRTSASAPWPACARWTTSRIGTQSETVECSFRARTPPLRGGAVFLSGGGDGATYLPNPLPNALSEFCCGDEAPRNVAPELRLACRPPPRFYRQMKAHWKTPPKI